MQVEDLCQLMVFFYKSSTLIDWLVDTPDESCNISKLINLTKLDLQHQLTNMLTLIGGFHMTLLKFELENY